MRTEAIGQRVVIYAGISDQWHGEPLHTAIIERARQHGLTGVTVIAGIEGYGTHGTVHREHLLNLTANLPVIIEIIDVPERIAGFLPVLDEMIMEGTVTIEACDLIRYA